MNAAGKLADTRILIADDVPANLTVLLDVLQESGAKVFAAEDGAGALEQLAHARPDVVLLDVMMPRLDGFETCRRIKADPAHATLPVIFMSALTEAVDKVRGFEAGAADYVTKPLHPAEVVARVQAHIALHRLQRELRHRNALLDAEVKRRQVAEQELRQSLDRAVLVAGGEGEILFCTLRAAEALREFFGAGEDVLPPALLAAISRGGALAFAHPQGRRMLTVRAFVERGAADCFTLVLEEADDARAAQERLGGLGLTPREAEILYWVMLGKSNAEVAVILDTAVNTVKKHLQNLMAKLGVESRLAAALFAREHLAGPR